MTENEQANLRTNIEQILKQQKQNEKELYEKEGQGWNLKFQNYWG